MPNCELLGGKSDCKTGCGQAAGTLIATYGAFFVSGLSCAAALDSFDSLD